MVLVEIGEPTLQTSTYEEITNKKALENIVTLLKKKREMTTIRMIACQQCLMQAHNQKVRHRSMKKEVWYLKL